MLSSAWTLQPGQVEPMAVKLSATELRERFPGLLRRDVERVARHRDNSEILVRQSCFFLHLGHLRVLTATSGQILVFDADVPSELSAAFARRLCRVLNENQSQSVEYLVLEQSLVASTENFLRTFGLLEPLTRRLLTALVSKADDQSSMQLVPVQAAISRLHTNLIAHNRAFLREKDLPHRLANFAPAAQAHNNEISMLISDYTARVEEILNQLEDLREDVVTVGTTVSQALSASRNQMMRLNLRIAIAALSTSVCSLGFSAFGMNLVSGFENHPFGFVGALLGMASMSGAVFAMSMAAYRKSRSIFNDAARNTSTSFFHSVNSPHVVFGLFQANQLGDEHLTVLLSSALGRPIQPHEVQEIKRIADRNQNEEVSLSELLRFLQRDSS